jgi:hypothetical protein
MRLIAAQDILRVPGKHIVRLTYTGSIAGEVKLNDEASEYKWFTIDELRALPEEELDLYFKKLLDEGIIV